MEIENINELNKFEIRKIKVQQALFELEIMGDKFAKENAEIIRDYIEEIEDENQKLKEKIANEFIK